MAWGVFDKQTAWDLLRNLDKPLPEQLYIPPERKVEIPLAPPQKVVNAGAEETALKIAHDKHVDIFVDLDRDKSYTLPLPDGGVTIVAEYWEINGHKFYLQEGKNTVPMFFAEHRRQILEQQYDRKKNQRYEHCKLMDAKPGPGNLSVFQGVVVSA